MHKDFDSWNGLKKKINLKEISDNFNFHEGDIWWTSFGLNVGSEIDGKHETFERPVLILKYISRDVVCVLPLTSRPFDGSRYHFKVNYEDNEGYVIFSQVKVISSKRLLRKVSKISKSQFAEVKKNFTKLFE